MTRVPGLSRVTALMSVGSLFADAATEMLAPILPIFLTQSLGATGGVIGLVDGVAQAVRNFVDGFSGAVSDHFRQRKIFVLSGYALSAVAKPLMGVSTVWEGVLAARLLDRLGAGIRSAYFMVFIKVLLGRSERQSRVTIHLIGSAPARSVVLVPP